MRAGGPSSLRARSWYMDCGVWCVSRNPRPPPPRRVHPTSHAAGAAGLCLCRVLLCFHRFACSRTPWACACIWPWAWRMGDPSLPVVYSEGKYEPCSIHDSAQSQTSVARLEGLPVSRCFSHLQIPEGAKTVPDRYMVALFRDFLQADIWADIWSEYSGVSCRCVSR